MTVKESFGTELQVDFEHTSPVNCAKIGVVMGSRSDIEPCTQYVFAMLEKLGIYYERGITSAHRTPERMGLYGRCAEERGLKVIIACAGGSAHLPGMLASETTLPVLGIAPSKGDDAAKWSMIRMPSGVPLSFLGFAKAGAENAVIMAARILALHDAELHDRLTTFMHNQTADVPYTCFD